jgi:hypothetical protein
MQMMRTLAGLTQYQVPRGCWGWDKGFILPANPNPQSFSHW